MNLYSEHGKMRNFNDLCALMMNYAPFSADDVRGKRIFGGVLADSVLIFGGLLGKCSEKIFAVRDFFCGADRES